MKIGGTGYLNSYRPQTPCKPKTNDDKDSGYVLSGECTKNMTFEEYKRYIDDRISKIKDQFPESCRDWCIDMSDDSYEAMKNNPEYEKFVLDRIRSSIEEYAGSKSRGVTVLHFGKSEEEFRSESWNLDVMESKSDDNAEDWWDKRMRLMAENLRQRIIIAEKRDRERSEIEKGLVFAERLNAADRQREILREGKDPDRNTDKNSVYSKAAIAAYRLGLIMENHDK